MTEKGSLWGNNALHEMICLLADKTKPEMRLADRFEQNDIMREMRGRGCDFSQANWSRLCKQAEAGGIIVSETFGRGTRYTITAAGQLHARQWQAIKAGQDICKPVPSPVMQTEPLDAAQIDIEEAIAAKSTEKQPQEAENTPKDGGTGDYSVAYAAALDKAARIDAAPSIERFGLLEQLAQSGDKWVRMPQFCTGRAIGGDAGRGREIMAAAGRKSMPRWTGRKLPNGKQEAQRVWVKKEAENG